MNCFRVKRIRYGQLETLYFVKKNCLLNLSWNHNNWWKIFSAGHLKCLWRHIFNGIFPHDTNSSTKHFSQIVFSVPKPILFSPFFYSIKYKPFCFKLNLSKLIGIQLSTLLNYELLCRYFSRIFETFKRFFLKEHLRMAD